MKRMWQAAAREERARLLLVARRPERGRNKECDLVRFYDLCCADFMKVIQYRFPTILLNFYITNFISNYSHAYIYMLPRSTHIKLHSQHTLHCRS